MFSHGGGKLSQTCFVCSLGRGEAISTDNGRSVAFVAIQKNPSGSFSTPGRETETQKGVVKGDLTKAEMIGGKLGETDQVLGFLLGGPGRRAGAACVPRQGRSAAGCGDGLRESPNLRSR